MSMPTWLLGRRSVTIESSAAISGRKSTDGRDSDQGQEGTGGTGAGDGHGGGLATTGPVPGSGGTTYAGPVGVGLGGLSPGSLSILVVSARYQLLFGPFTTPGGVVYHRLPGTPASAWETKVCTPGEATKTPSEPGIMKCR